jgi:predicted TIM-barrel fold metal-dependent hydrolase
MAGPNAAVAELERAAGLGFVGAMVYGRAGDTPLDDPHYDDLFRGSRPTAADLHPPADPSRTIRQAVYGGFDPMTDLALATFGWGWHVEAAVARFASDRPRHLRPPSRPATRARHWGELLLFWTDRVDGLSRIAGLDRKVSDYIRSNIHITSSGMLNPTLLRHALEVTTTDRLLFSTDYPFQRPVNVDIEQFLTAFPTDDDREKFTAGNACSLFGISLSTK